MNVMAQAHKMTREAFALATVEARKAMSYAKLFRSALIHFHKEYKAMIANRLYRILATNEKTGEITTHDFDSGREMVGARRELYETGLYSCLQTLDREQGEWLVDQTFHYSPEQLKEVRAINRRIANEKKVVGKIVTNAIKLGYVVSVYDGEEYTVKRSTDKAAIMGAIYTTDMDRLVIRDKAGEHIGTVALVYGNSASEVMNDWHDSELMNKVLEPAIKFCDELSAKGL